MIIRLQKEDFISNLFSETTRLMSMKQSEQATAANLVNAVTKSLDDSMDNSGVLRSDLALRSFLKNVNASKHAESAEPSVHTGGSRVGPNGNRLHATAGNTSVSLRSTTKSVARFGHVSCSHDVQLFHKTHAIFFNAIANNNATNNAIECSTYSVVCSTHPYVFICFLICGFMWC